MTLGYPRYFKAAYKSYSEGLAASVPGRGGVHHLVVHPICLIIFLQLHPFQVVHTETILTEAVYPTNYSYKFSMQAHFGHLGIM